MTKKKSAERRRLFAEAFNEALAISGLSRVELARKLGVTESGLSYWLTGQRLPSPDKVFEIERALRCPPGHLSRHLEYLPVNGAEPLSVEEAIQGCDLSPENRTRLLDLYRHLRGYERQLQELRDELDEGRRP